MRLYRKFPDGDPEHPDDGALESDLPIAATGAQRAQCLQGRMMTLPPDVAQKLGFHVYLYIDPRNGQIFYVGKCVGCTT